ncbi:MAG: hypothetical protein AAF705_00395 [Bacteroidota bacterium]
MKIPTFLLVLVVILISADHVLAQIPDTITFPYEITGVIYDKKGKPISGVSILSRGDANNSVSDNNGAYVANVDSPSLSVLFYYRKHYTFFIHCPDGRRKVDIVLTRIKNWRIKRALLRIKAIFKKKEKIATEDCI